MHETERNSVLSGVLSGVLMEVAPSEEHVAPPPEGTMGHWVAVDGGGFEECPEDVASDVWKKSVARNHAVLQPCKTIVKRRHRARKGGKGSRKEELEVMPRAKDRSERHRMVSKRVYVVWPELQGPTRFYGTVVKYDSFRDSSLRVHYDDGDKRWEPAADVHVAEA